MPRRNLLILTLPLLLSTLLPVRAAADADPVGVWPLQPRPAVVAGFDPPDSAYGAGHRGVDLLGHPGEVVHAALAGTISFAGPLAGRGVVVVDHGSTRTTYEPVDASVHIGQHVAAGAPIGRLTTTQSHCFPQACLHWGWIRGQTYLDPLLLVGGGPIRLLPLSGAPAQPAPVAGSGQRRWHARTDVAAGIGQARGWACW